MERREFCKAMGMVHWSLGGWGAVLPGLALGGQETNLEEAIMGKGDFPSNPISKREFLDTCVLRRETVDQFLSGRGWAVFDSDLGYRHNNSTHQTGMDGALCFSRYESGGERKMIHWADKACRINTYGDSFTNCAQVSDGETWQEYMAAHIGEPIRNFGVGGFGVYQAYRRMQKVEESSSSADYLILNIFDGDHIRSLHKCRWFTLGQYRDAYSKKSNGDSRVGWPKDFHESPWFHANPWPYVHIDPETGNIVENDNPYPTPESLYKLCDKEHVYESFKDDLALEIILAISNGKFSHPEKMTRLCRLMGVEGDPNDPGQCRQMADALYRACGFLVTIYTIEQAMQFASSKKKKLMVMLSYSGLAVASACQKALRLDQVLVDFLAQTNLPYFDSLQKHIEEFRSFQITPEEYVKRYYIGHYSPLGNRFFAYAAKDSIVEWLDPKPPAYRLIA